MSNRKKHEILKALFKKYKDGENKTSFGKEVTSLGRSMTNIEIHNRTNISIADIDNFGAVLVSYNCISQTQFDISTKVRTFLITPVGQTAYIEKSYLNKVWYKQTAIIISVLAFVVPSIIALYGIKMSQRTHSKQNSYEQRLQNIEKLLVPKSGK